MDKLAEQKVRIKLCGMTRPQDAALASALGADAIGMIFHQKSARNISLTQASEIISVINPFCAVVAVLVNPDEKYLDKLLSTLAINIIQFHGDESAEFCESFATPYIKVIAMRSGVSLSQKREEYASASALLLDTYDKTLAGGTGRRFDWSVLEGLNHKHLQQPELVLAGGLSPNNAKQAIAQTGVRNLDVNSGIESAPGIKDHAKMRAIMQIRANQTL